MPRIAARELAAIAAVERQRSAQPPRKTGTGTADRRPDRNARNGEVAARTGKRSGREAVKPGPPVAMTMHRAKGTEFSKVLLFGMSEKSSLPRIFCSW